MGGCGNQRVDAKGALSCRKLKGRMDKRGHYDVQIKRVDAKGGHYDVQIKRADG